MDELRWFLLVIGALVIAGIYGYARWQEYRHNGPRRARAKPANEPDIDTALRNLDASIGDISPVDPDEGPLPGPLDDAPEPAAEKRTVRAEKPRAKEPPAAESSPQLEEKVIVIHVAGPKGVMYRGEDLVRALEGANMVFGEHRIFHRFPQSNHSERPLFSAASMIEPGWFDVDNLEAMRSPGLALFMQLPAPFDGLEAFEQMHATARSLAEMLGATLLDARRCNLTQQAVEHIREELREYRRQAHLKARQRQQR